MSSSELSGLKFEYRATAGAFVAHGDREGDPAWAAGQFIKDGNDTLPLSAAVLSYGCGIIEGLKVHRAADGRLLLFRAADHAARFVRSAERMMLLPYPAQDFVAAVKQVVTVNRDFVPSAAEGSFYLRPLLFGVDEMLGMRVGRLFRVVIYGSPVGALHSDRGLALDVLETSRAPAGGTAEAKAIVNYAGTLMQRMRAREQGFDDVLFTGEGCAQETTGTNLFCLLDSGVLVTPALDGRFLGGITRDSVIALAKHSGLEVQQRPLPVSEMLEHGNEVFCTGTASGVLSVSRMRYRDAQKDFEGRELAAALGEQLQAIKEGAQEDPFGWIEQIEL
jgi:branched-chain amino acid aminotransferase